MRSSIPKPWDAFLSDVDQTLQEPLELHCIGGFAVVMHYGLEDRPTADVGVLAVKPYPAGSDLMRRAGEGSLLHKTHGVYFQLVTVLGAWPANYDQRLSEMFPGAFRQLRLFALDPYDLALTKLERNRQRDREDVLFLAEAVPFDIDTLRKRYELEMRPNLGNPEREDLTLRLWMEAIEERRRTKKADRSPST